MIAVVQRVSEAKVVVEDRLGGKINQGLLVLLAVEKGDTVDDVAYITEKIVNLRIFADEQGNMNRSLKEVGGELLAVSQFTLAGNTRKGRRPSFDKAAGGLEARQLYQAFVEYAGKKGVRVQQGVFWSDDENSPRK